MCLRNTKTKNILLIFYFVISYRCFHIYTY